MAKKRETILSLNKKIKILREIIITYIHLSGNLSQKEYDTISKRLEKI